MLTAKCLTCGQEYEYPYGRGRKRTHCGPVCRERSRLVRKAALKATYPSRPKCANTACNGRVMLRIGASLCEACYCYQRRTGRPRQLQRPRGHYTAAGYKVVRANGHPLARKSGWVAEHRLVAFAVNGGVCPGCYWCGTVLTWQAAVIDHLNESKSDNRPENLVVSCNDCNRSRGAMLPFLWGMRPEAQETFFALAKCQMGVKRDVA